MNATRSVEFFDSQFRRQVAAGEFELNPFEQRALPYLAGAVLDLGCGLGNLALSAARRGCRVTATDGSPTAIAHLREVAAAEALALEAVEADLRNYPVACCWDTVVAIGLLMFFPCPVARERLAAIRAAVRPGGCAVVNLLTEGTDFLDMFDPASGHCLFAEGELARAFDGWEILDSRHEEFPAPGGRRKAFDTVIARRPA